MKVWIAISMLLLSSACGRGVDIRYHMNTPQPLLNNISGYDHTLGYAIWDENWRQEKTCDIYLAQFDMFKTDACYKATLAHEQRHCYEGNFHPNTAEASYEDACREGVSDENIPIGDDLDGGRVPYNPSKQND